MRIREIMGRAIRWGLGKLGYRLLKVKWMPFGIDPWRDIQRLSELWEIDLATIFDVGANEGDTALELNHRWPAANILCFEPTRRIFETLCRIVGHSGNVRFYNIALGATSGLADLFTYPTSVINSLTPDAQGARRFGLEAVKETCTVRTLDDFCTEEGIRRINVLKIDTEGFDLEVLQGAQGLLAQGRIDFIYVEFNSLLPKSGSRGGALLPIGELLEPYNFHFVASYTDLITVGGEFFAVLNALFVRRIAS